MIAYIRGILAAATPLEAIVETHGIGYQIFIPASLYSQLPQCGKELQLHTSFIVREQSHALYGFLTTQERDLFDLLLTVTGIGPKLALSLLGHMPAGSLCEAVQKGNIAALCRIPGIGKKTAERMVIEIKDKLLGFAIPSPSGSHEAADDALSALLNLGYQRSAAQKAIQAALSKADGEIDLAGLITSSLKCM